MLTTVLDAAGALLLVAAAFVLFGLGAALGMAGVGLLLVSWTLSGRPLFEHGERR